MMATRTCPECGKDFEPSYRNQVVCGDGCKAARRKRLNARHKRASLARRAKKQPTAAAERKEKARRRAAFFAARDAAFERAGIPIPKIEERDGIVIETRGQRCIAPRICI